MTTQIAHFIDGQRTAGQSQRTADVLNPSTGQVQATVPMGSAADVDAAVASAAEAQKGWAATNPQRRARVMMRFIELVNANMDELAELLSREHGKTVADARGDIQRGIEVVEFCVGIPHLLKGEYTEGAGPGIDVYSLRQPLGVVAGITPFNFPAMIPLWKAGPALACGNAFILKPSERDPSVPVRLAELFIQAGLPPGVFQVVHGDKEAVDAILHHPDIAAVGFVGSSDIAQYIYATAAANGKRAQCFGGAKNHMIVMPDADLDQAVDALIGAGYGSAGERCMAISVAVPVGEQTADRLRARLVERINNLRVGHSLDPKADYGPLVTAAALARVRDYIGQGVAAGAELVVDGRERASNDLTFGEESLESGFFIGPTLFDRVTTDMSIYTDEIFGPVLCIVRAADYEEALRLPSEHEYGNGVAIFTRDGDSARDFTARVQAGMVGVNVPIPVPVAYHTFGGWKRSGFGDLNQHGPAAIQFYTKVKTVTQRWPSGIKDGAEFHIPTME
ncbi:CoA-acylating methylmalonate-semialdehyde dehydrogenase [Mycobacterium talmoniae]|uniref:methylmalonate-semialdehyde dehydrogenase (CoA acylating) n=1 Tax=Mycobacterium talmoniae TaxID=1858794 RepID=A0A1S1NE96_9MYCO|nr:MULTISPECIES: CoA-acylating methylmalonate-semialdehyde dehydrogenase [Mycobacterium]OHU98139.1 methylmalonate-semialdehyde dehydrogenase (acylating) [Mycobacterium talmoniae]TDH48099.1 CoA-acylating methylmalonate-semialdehyde dehydrogenase [Mycobacterium eburneum]